VKVRASRILDFGSCNDYLASRYICFFRGGRAPSTYWMGGWVFLRAGLDVTQVRSPSAHRSLNSTVARTLVPNALY